MGGLNRTVPPNSPGSGSSDAGRGEVKKTDSSPVRIHPRILRFGPGDVTDDPADRAKGETSETRESGGNCFIYTHTFKMYMRVPRTFVPFIHFICYFTCIYV